MNTTTETTKLLGAIGYHESGAMVKVYIIEGKAYVLLLKSAPIFTTSGEWWGCHNLTAASENMYLYHHDLPGGTTKQFEDKKGFVKQYFPWKGPGEDPMHVDASIYKGIESGTETALRETKEETNGIICPRPEDINHLFMVDGGYKQNASGHKSQTIILLSIEKDVTPDDLLRMRMRFLQRNMEAFMMYNTWARDNPLSKENEAEHWAKRPEFDDMTFIEWNSFCGALNTSRKQLNRYRKNKNEEGKGAISFVTDYVNRPIPIMLRSWPVMILETVTGKMAHVITKEMHS